MSTAFVFFIIILLNVGLFLEQNEFYKYFISKLLFNAYKAIYYKNFQRGNPKI